MTHLIKFYMDLCNMSLRATRENPKGIELVPEFLGTREKVEQALKDEGKLDNLLKDWGVETEEKTDTEKVQA